MLFLVINDLWQAIVSAKLLHKLDYATVADRLEVNGITGGTAFWEAVRGNLNLFSDAKVWWLVVNGSIAPVIEDQSFTNKALDLLPAEPWSIDTWGQWTAALKSATGAKGKSLFHPLRLALTGQDSGPDLKSLLLLIGRERAVARLSGVAG